MCEQVPKYVHNAKGNGLNLVITTDPFMEHKSAIHVKRIARDPKDRELLNKSDEEDGRKKPITSLVKSEDGTHFLTSSLDKSGKLWDSRTLKLIKTYEHPVNAVAMSPLFDRVVLGGGQDASSVTTTYNPGTKFQAKFYDKILTKEIGGVKGHFGPINAL
ncbi:Eukaryotic translation initiation factor 3 subunit I [Castilleja foliolosa]|uniref:Serine-threonine kinase receptor-associated protein n=1 Tax=Castilleja foliolosa TaxID=1961234 RepID=A0ABD3BCP1_9LAMI